MIGFSGCSGFTTNQDESTVQDTDGDGVIDSEDYAPRDESVQRAEQVQEGGSTQTEESEETTTQTEESEETTTQTEAEIKPLASFEDGWDGFEVRINEQVKQGTDASAERTTDDSHKGTHSVRVECAKNNGDGDVTVRRSGIDVSQANRLIVWSKLVVGNTYGSPRIRLTDQKRGWDTAVHDLRDQRRGAWQSISFDISYVDTLRIDIVAASGAGAEQEALVDNIAIR